jgi:hypothetical protein
LTVKHVDHFNAAAIEKIARCYAAVHSQLSLLSLHTVSLTRVLIENPGGKFSSIFQLQIPQKQINSNCVGIRRIKGLFHHTRLHRNAVEHILHPEHAGNLPRIRRTAPKFDTQLPDFPPMAVLRPAATLSKPFLIATWVKQEDSAELAEQKGLRRRARIGDLYP